MMMKFSSLNIFKLIVANAMLIGATVNATSLWSLNATDINGDIVGQARGTGVVNKASLAIFSNLRGIMDR